MNTTTLSDKSPSQALIHGRSGVGLLPLTVWVGPDTNLTCETVERTAAALDRREPGAFSPVGFTDAAEAAVHAAHKRLGRLQKADTPVYGTTTGFGPFVGFASADQGRAGQGAGLIAHLGAGWGPEAAPWTPAEVVRAAMIVRAQTVAQGYSGIRPAVAAAYIDLLNAGIVPCVPPIGSVGASGDLIPLAHIARVLTGEGRVFFRGEIVGAADALQVARLVPLTLEGRDALALTNGTSFLSGITALATARAERLLFQAERLTGWMYRLLGARTSALDPRLHRARGHAGQMQSASHIRAEATAHNEEGSAGEDVSRPLQEVYSIRCAPQVLGACRENLEYARRLVETEINGVSDNPLLFDDDDSDTGAVALHGGNFQGQQVAFGADALNAALTQAGVLAERQIDVLLSPSRSNEHAPLLLAWEPGVTSGLAGAQLTATSLVAEMRAHCNAHATFSIPTNGGNQDVVSMGALAARMALGQTEYLSAILAVLAMSLAQLTFLRDTKRASGRVFPLPIWMPDFEPVQQDRPLHDDIARLGSTFLHTV